MRDTRKKKIVHFSFLKSLNAVIILCLAIAVLLAGIVILVLNSKNVFSNEQELSLSVATTINAFLVVSPLVLFVLCIVISSIFSADLSKKKISINQLSRFESLSKIKVICFERENIIVDGTLTIKKVIPLKTVATDQYINQWLSNMLRATNDKGVVFDALSKQYDFELSAGIVSVLPYNDKIKYSGASFKGGKTIVLGDPESIPIKNKIGILKRCEEDINKGCRILIVGEGKELLDSDGYHDELEAIALIVLKEHVREGVFETFKWFKDKGYDIKVISEENAIVTSVNAAEAGLDGADKYISLAGIDNERIESLVSEYNVFGNVSSEQKEVVINALKKDQQVMMVGGNESDVLAMKASNYAVTTIDGDAASQNNADIVLENSSSDLLPLVIKKSKVFVNNLEKILSMSLAKTVFAFLLVLFFIILNNNLKQCLFVFNHLLLCDLLTNGVSLFLLTFDKSNARIKGKFIANALRKAIPITILQIAGVLTVFLLFIMQQNHLFSIGLYSTSEVAVMCALIFGVFGITSLYSICAPLNKQRRIVVIVGAIINVLAIAAIMLIAYLGKNEEIPYVTMNGPAYFIAAIIAAVYSSIYLSINRIINIIKGDNLDYEN